MFGLSLTKILFTIGIVVAVWRGFKLFEKFQKRVAQDRTDEPASRRSGRKSDAACRMPSTWCPARTATPMCRKGQFCPSAQKCVHNRA